MALLIVLPLFLFQSRGVRVRTCAYHIWSSIPGCFSVQHWNALVALYSVKGEPCLRKQGCSYLALEKTVW